MFSGLCNGRERILFTGIVLIRRILRSDFGEGDERGMKGSVGCVGGRVGVF